MTDLYVSTSGSDTNNGSANAPFLTIAAAAAAAGPGTTINVAPGTYAGGFTTSASGTAAAPITYVSTVPGGAHIVGAGTASTAMGWDNEGSNVIVTGFNIDGSGSLATSWRFGFYSTGSNVVFENNTVHDILTNPTAFAAASSSGGGGAGIEMDNYDSGTQGSVIGNTVYNIGPSNQTSTLVHGIYQIESGTVANNVVYNVVGNGVTSWHGSDNINIINNTIDNARDGGIFVGSGDGGSSSTTGDYFTVKDNVVVNSAWGIAEGGTTGIHNVYVDNLLYNNTANTISLQNGLTATGTIIANPLFVNEAASNYQLQSGSPAIDAGTLSGAPSTDIDGVARSGEDDIGAFQHVASDPSPTSDPTPTPTPTPTPAPTPDPTPTVITVPASQASATIAVNNATINATGGNHLFFISGNTDTFNPSGGTETITDSGTGGNTFNLPPAGNGSVVFTNPVFNNHDVFDLSATLAATGWNGSASSLGSYLHTKESDGNTELLVSTNASRHASRTLLATFDSQDVKLSTILTHSIT
jgi:hypothetical protein